MAVQILNNSEESMKQMKAVDSIPSELDEDIARFAGIMQEPSAADLDQDERLKRIWER